MSKNSPLTSLCQKLHYLVRGGYSFISTIGTAEFKRVTNIFTELVKKLKKTGIYAICRLFTAIAIALICALAASAAADSICQSPRWGNKVSR